MRKSVLILVGITVLVLGLTGVGFAKDNASIDTRGTAQASRDGTPGPGGIPPQPDGTPGAGGLPPRPDDTPGAGGLPPQPDNAPGAGGLPPQPDNAAGPGGVPTAGADPAHAPEIDFGSGVSALTLLIGSLLVVRGRRYVRAD